MEHVEVVASDAPHHFRHLAFDLVALALGDRAQAAHQLAQPSGRRRHLRLRPQPDIGAVRQQRLGGDHVVHHVAVGDRARAAGVVAGHPSNGRLCRRTDIDREPHSMRSQPRVQCVEHDAGLHGDRHGFAVEVHHAAQMLAVVDHQRRADGLPALRASPAARQQRNAEIAADVDGSPHVVVRPRNQHADRFDLIDGRIGRVAAARRAVEAHLSAHGTAQAAREFIVARRVEDQRPRQVSVRPGRVHSSPSLSARRPSSTACPFSCR
jgi:hypothetical protein